jgi:hypothetical protein
MLIYETVVPLSVGRHRDRSVAFGTDYGFSRKVSAVPLTAVEFPEATADYAIVFAGEGGALMPAAILGLGGENLYVSEDGAWQAGYIPAFVRRYPFVFSTGPDGRQLVLCVDEAFSGFNREGRGEKLFEADGKPTAYVDNALRFLREYQAQFHRTQEFCKKVQELDVLAPVRAELDLASGERRSFGGFMAIDRAKLRALPADKLAELARTDELELLYLHLHSLRNFNAVRDRFAAARQGSAQPDETAPAQLDAGGPGGPGAE